MNVRHHRTMIRQLLPGIVLPGLIYFVASRFTSVVMALAIASMVPLLDALLRVAQRKSPSPVGLAFVGMAGLSVGLAIHLNSPIFILIKGAVMSAALGIAFSVSAAIRRPLTRTLALRLSTDHADARHRLSERWRHPKAHSVFCMLSVGWGILLLMLATQQALAVLTMSPGTVMALEPSVQGLATILGIVTSVAYVRRVQQAHPDLGLLPARASAA